MVRRRWGLLQQVPLPAWLSTLVAVVLLDYTLYLWHVLAHRSPLLWRAHSVHHIDRDLDVSTGVRFHFAELIASAPWRAGQVALIGVNPAALSVWQLSSSSASCFIIRTWRFPYDSNAGSAESSSRPACTASIIPARSMK